VDLVTPGAGTTAVEPAEGLLRDLGLRPSRWSAPAGTWFAAHVHAEHEVLLCVAGSIDFLVARLPMRAGDCLDLPAHSRHEAVAGPSGVTCVEAYRG
jgi:hypothetical protein